MITPQIAVGTEVAFGVKEKNGNGRLFYHHIQIYRGKVLQMPKPHSYFVEYEVFNFRTGLTTKIRNTITLSAVHSFKWGGVWVNNPNCSKEIKQIYP